MFSWLQFSVENYQGLVQYLPHPQVTGEGLSEYLILQWFIP